MHTGKGQVLEVVLKDGQRHLRLSCSSTLVPPPGQYLLASDESDAPLPVPLFYTDSAPQGFIAAAAADSVSWDPGRSLSLRGPLGRGYKLPAAARRVGLVAFDDHAARLRGLIQPAIEQDASVVLVGRAVPDTLPDVVEVQPLSALDEIVEWADYIALDVDRENLVRLREHLRQRNHAAATKAQVLVRTPLPCGGIADCGACAVTLRSDWKFACKDGPVFDWDQLEPRLGVRKFPT
jgi:dihydroorotate dehydrogenase electron transfer subunit